MMYLSSHLAGLSQLGDGICDLPGSGEASRGPQCGEENPGIVTGSLPKHVRPSMPEFAHLP